ncbi:MAG: DUF433 domain-containing protein [Chloroflexi bacterium]|nr:DUF433 domain-containing protein [Chloroflexota bacterium]
MTDFDSGITTDPSVHFGKPVIRGTRVLVEVLVSHVASGISVKDVAKEYGITEQDVYNALNYAAQYLANGPTSNPAKISSPVRVHKYYPNKFGLIMISSLEEMVDRPSFEHILNSSDLRAYIDPLARNKIDNLEKGFDFAYISAFCAALDDVYGTPGSIDMARQIGADSFLYGLQNFGLLRSVSQIYYSFLPYQTKLRKSLGAVAKVLTQLSDQKCVVTENEHEFLFTIHECPYCVGRTSSSPICYVFGGFLSEFVLWVTGEKNTAIEERKCKAMGDLTCEFSIKKHA